MEKKVKSVIPIYMIGLTCYLYGLVMPLNKLSDLLFMLAAGAAAYIIFNLLVPAKTVVVPVEMTINKTGDAEADAVIAKGKEYMQSLDKLNENIKDEKLSRQMDELKAISKQIYEFIAENPKNSRQINKFSDYYFPTVLKLLGEYNAMASQQVRVGNMEETMGKIDLVMDNIVTAFKNQLDNLYQHKVLDINSDIDVLKNILAQEGLDR